MRRIYPPLPDHGHAVEGVERLLGPEFEEARAVPQQRARQPGGDLRHQALLGRHVGAV